MTYYNDDNSYNLNSPDRNKPFSDTYEQRFGYLRLNSIDMSRWENGYMQGSPFLWHLIFLITNHLYTLLLLGFYFAECALFMFCIPRIGFGDSKYPLLMEFEYSIPSGYFLYIFVVALGLDLTLKAGYNFVWKGVLANSDGNITLGTVMLNRYARRIICLTSYSKWRLFRYLISQLNFQEYSISWIIWCSDEWKRFMTLKSVIFVIAVVQLYDALNFIYIPQNPQVQQVFLAYWSIKIIEYSFEFISKVTALIMYYFIYRNTITEVRNGCSLSDYYQNRIIERAAPFITLKNPFLEPPPPSSSFKSSNGVTPVSEFSGGNFYESYRSNGKSPQPLSKPTYTGPQMSSSSDMSGTNVSLTKNEIHLPVSGLDSSDVQAPKFPQNRNESFVSNMRLNTSAYPQSIGKSAYFESEYHPSRWSRGESFLTDDEEDE